MEFQSYAANQANTELKRNSSIGFLQVDTPRAPVLCPFVAWQGSEPKEHLVFFEYSCDSVSGVGFGGSEEVSLLKLPCSPRFCAPGTWQLITRIFRGNITTGTRQTDDGARKPMLPLGLSLQILVRVSGYWVGDFFEGTHGTPYLNKKGEKGKPPF